MDTQLKWLRRAGVSMPVVQAQIVVLPFTQFPSRSRAPTYTGYVTKWKWHKHRAHTERTDIDIDLDSREQPPSTIRCIYKATFGTHPRPDTILFHDFVNNPARFLKNTLTEQWIKSPRKYLLCSVFSFCRSRLMISRFLRSSSGNRIIT